MHKRWIASALVALSTLSMQAQTPPRRQFVRASGDVSVFVAPDQVIVDAGVSTQGRTAQDASSQYATQAAAVVTALNQLLGTGADIKTLNYFVGPNYQYPSGGGTPTVTGYTASITVEVRLNAV